MLIKQIAEGWFNGFLNDINLLDEKTKNLGQSRMSICLTCPVRTGNVCDKGKSGKNQLGFPFRGCNCRIDKKTLCKECTCPGGRW